MAKLYRPNRIVRVEIPYTLQTSFRPAGQGPHELYMPPIPLIEPAGICLITEAFPVTEKMTFADKDIPPVPEDRSGIPHKHALFAARNAENGIWTVTRYFGQVIQGKITGGRDEIFRRAAAQQRMLRWLKDYGEILSLRTGNGQDVSVDHPLDKSAKLVTKGSRIPDGEPAYSR